QAHALDLRQRAADDPLEIAVETGGAHKHAFELLFLANENEQVQLVSLPGAWQDSITGEESSEVLLGPVDVRVLRIDF
ncbi:MAG: hypothetical protein HGA66_16745, partial [Holophaga sp.]|nr:hypothetical protein [Holophaga sp.]